MKALPARRLPRASCLPRLACALLASISAACVHVTGDAPSTRSADRIKAAFVVVGEGGRRIARIITVDDACPNVSVDGRALPMRLRAPAQVEPQRPTRSDPADSKPSAFPVRVCELALGDEASRASVAGHELALGTRDPRRIVVVGDSGCRIKRSDNAFQACNDAAVWPFARIAAAAAAMHPDLVLHLGDYHYRENACPPGTVGCAGSPWGYGWDAWDADFFAPAAPLLSAAPWIFVRGNHESCNRAGQGWWRFLDPRALVAGRDCNDASNDADGDFSEPYAVPLSRGTQLIVFDSSNVGVAPLTADDALYRTYAPQFGRALALASGVAHNVFVNHHPILGFAADPTHPPDGVYAGNASLQSVLAAYRGEALFPPNIDVLIAGHNHLFELVSFSTAHPIQLISGNGGTSHDAALPRTLGSGAAAVPGALVESIASTNLYGFTSLEPDSQREGAWQARVWDERGNSLATCSLAGRTMRCTSTILH